MKGHSLSQQNLCKQNFADLCPDLEGKFHHIVLAQTDSIKDYNPLTQKTLPACSFSYKQTFTRLEKMRML